MRRTGLHILLDHFHTELFENVMEAAFGHLVPEDRRLLISRNHISNRGIDFLKGIRRAAGNQDIVEACDAGIIGHGILIHRKTAERGAVESELNAFHKAVFRGLGHDEIAALQNIAERNGRGSAADHFNSLRLLGFISVFRHLCYGVSAGRQIGNGDAAVGTGGHRLVDPVAADIELDPGDLTVLGMLHNLGFAVADLQLHVGIDRVGYTFAPGYKVLDMAGVGIADGTVGPNHHTHSGRGFGSREGHTAGRRLACSNGQRVTRLGYRNP